MALNRTAKEMLLPVVSVIMPIKNEEKYIGRSLNAVLNQNYPTGYLEVLVIDGHSSDRTREIISLLSKNSRFPIFLIDNPTGIVPKALNIGLNVAKGEIVIRVDGHCEIQRNYVLRCVTNLQNQENIECVGGTIDTIGETFVAQSIALAMSTSFGVGNVAFRVNNGRSHYVDSVPFPAYTRSVFDRIGHFDEEMLCNEDDEFNYRLLKNKGRILLDKDITTRYYSRGSLKALWKQYFRYGLWKVRVMQKHPGQMRVRQFIPSLFVVTLIISILLMLLIPYGWIFFVTLFGVYVFTVLVISLHSIQRNDLRQLFLLPIIYLTLHTSYGSGFLYGFYKFRGFFNKP